MTWIEKGHPALVLAPMEGILDAPMRALLTERGSFSFCVSEFLRVSQEVPPARTYLEHVPELRQGGATVGGTPVQLQLLGGDPAKLALAALAACRLGARAIDLNFGCPAPTVNRHDGGATLLKFPERIRSIVAEVRRAVPREIPVSAKLRLGWDDIQAIHLNAEMAAQGGASWITIHGRTKMQGYVPPAYWGPIGEVRRNVGIPVVANGEIMTLDDFKRCRDETGCEHFMIGRGAIADPSLSLQIARELGVATQEERGIPELRQNEGCDPALGQFPSIQWHELLTRFSELSRDYQYKSGYLPCRMKQWVRYAHMRKPIPWYDRIKTLSTAEQILQAISNA